MSLFKCDNCGVLENTALAKSYWLAKIEKRPLLCSQCGKPGFWHEDFPRKTPEEWGVVLATDGYYYTPEEIQRQSYRIQSMEDYLKGKENGESKKACEQKSKKRRT